MRIALLGDIHGNLSALGEVLADIDKRSVDAVYCTGDIVGYGPQPDEVIDVVRNMRIKTVMGNHDDAVGYNLPVCGCSYPAVAARVIGDKSLAWTKKVVSKENRRYLRELPEELGLDLPGGAKALVFHGSPKAINQYIHSNLEEDILEDITAESPAGIFIFGHTHIPFVRSFKNRLFINVGSVGQPKDHDARACYALADVYPNGVSIRFIRVKYDKEEVIKLINELGLPSELGEMLRKGCPL